MHSLLKQISPSEQWTRCDTGVTLLMMPTKRPRHAITETSPVRAALDELRRELGTERVKLADLVVLGAREEVARLRRIEADAVIHRRRLAERIRSRDIPSDIDAAEQVRRSGWVRAES